MMQAVRRHRKARLAELLQIGAQLLPQRYRGVQEQPALGEPDHGHARSDLDAAEALRALDDPQAGAKLSHGDARYHMGCRPE